ncbi:MAG: hypothetical protein WC806_01255 [Candidatus Gracilibacteria bacterium]|jgi:sugar phosphate isomerase/epimerase
MITLSTDSLHGYGLNRIFKLAKDANYDALDLCVDFGNFDTFNTDYVKSLVDQYKMPIHSISAPQNARAEKIKDLVALAKAVKAKVLILQPPKILNFKLSTWIKNEVPKLREKEFISIAIENASGATFLGIIPEYSMSNTQELKDFKHVSLDTARIGEQKKDLMRAYAVLKKYLVNIHLSNIFHGKKYAPPKEGIMPLESFLTKLKQDRYPGAIAIKVLPKFLHAGDDEKVVDELKTIKKYCDKYYTNVEVSKEDKEEESK